MLGTERLSESTGLGFVRLTAVTAGAWLEVATKSGWSLQVRAELHKPYSASIEGQVENGSPSGQFASIGVAGAYRFDILTMQWTGVPICHDHLVQTFTIGGSQFLSA